MTDASLGFSPRQRPKAANYKTRGKLPAWLTGAVVGATFWILLWVANPTLRFLERRHDFFASWLPGWLMRMGWFGLDIDYLQDYVARLTSPLTGNWLAPDSLLGLCVYLLIAAAVFSVSSIVWNRRFSLRSLLVLMTVLAILFGFATILFR